MNVKEIEALCNKLKTVTGYGEENVMMSFSAHSGIHMHDEAFHEAFPDAPRSYQSRKHDQLTAEVDGIEFFILVELKD